LADSSNHVRLGRLWLAGLAAALALYVATLAPDLAWQDSGDYQYEAARLNFSRPGDAVRVHPWFLLTAWLLGRVEWWNYAYAANLSSAIGTAIAVANVLVLGRLMTGRLWPAVVGAASFAVGHAVWSHAVVAETYGWAAAFLSAECLCAWAFLAHRRVRWILLLFFIDGVAISNHLMAGLGLAVFTVWVLVACVRGRAPWWSVPAGLGCWLVGGTLYWIVAAMEYWRTGSAAETLQAVTVGRWASQVFNLADLPGLFVRSAQYVALNYPTPLILAIPIGAIALLRRREAMARLVLVLGAVYLVWAARYKVVDQYAFFIPFYVLASVMVAAGARAVLDRVGRWGPAVLLVAALVPVGVYAVLPALGRRIEFPKFDRALPYRDSYAYFLRPWQTGNEGPRRFARETLESLPAGAVLFTDTTPRPPLVCLQALEAVRPDVRLAVPGGLGPETVGRYWNSRRNLVPEFAADGRRVFVVSDHRAYMPRWMAAHTKRVPFGLVFEVVDAADGRPVEVGK